MVISQGSGSVIAEFSNRVIEFSARASSIVEERIPVYGDMREKGEGHYLRESLSRLYSSFVEFAASKATEPDEAFVAQTRQRAYEGVPLESILKVWRVTNQLFWEELNQIVEDVGHGLDPVIEIWSIYLAFYDLTVQASEDAYKEAQKSRDDVQRLSATMTLDSLLVETDPDAINLMLSSVGLFERDLIVVAGSLRVKESERLEVFPRFIPLLTSITTSAGVRPPWTTNGNKFVALAERASLSDRIKKTDVSGISIGISASYIDTGSLAECYDQALKALCIAGEDKSVVYFDELTTFERIAVNSSIEMTDLPGWLVTYLREDEARAAAWSQTVQALIDCGGNVANAAKLLFVHTNTVYYRIAAIRSACGIDVLEPENLTSAHFVGLLMKVKSGSGASG